MSEPAKGLKGFEKLSPAKQKLLLARLEEARRQREAAEGVVADEGIPRSPLRESADPAFPLSFSQRRLWFLDRLEPGSTAYVLLDTLRLTGHLSVPAMAAALSEIVRRHEALRTVFGEQPGGEPVQRVVPPQPLAVPVADLSGLPRPRAEEELARLVAGEARPFDLARGPHLRALLLRLGPEEHGAALATHHIVSDGWSMGVLVREMTALYAAVAQGKPSPLPELPLQYPDFAHWQRGYLAGETLEELLGYWRRQLEGAPFVLDLPTDRPRPSVSRPRGGSVHSILPRDLTEAASRLGRRAGETLFMVLLAAYGALLARFSGQEDFCVGSPVAGRNRIETEDLIGFFVNMLVLRMDLRGVADFAALLERVRTTTLGAYEHQDLPFERLVEELHPVRDLSRAPLFQTTLALQNAPKGELRLPGLEVAPLAPGPGAALFDLVVEAMEAPEGLAVHWRYDAELFDGATVARLAGWLERMLRGVVATPERSWQEMPLLEPAEERQLLAAGRGGVALGAGVTFGELFRASVARHPQEVAVVFGGERLSYAELAQRARDLAARLVEAGVGPEVRVGICLERSVELVVAILAVVEAGGAWVPLDPALPGERLGLIVVDAGVAVAMVDGSGRSELPDGVRLVEVSDRAQLSDRPLSASSPLPAEAESLAYVLFTSGSTGRPKGVMITQGGLANLALDLAGRLGLGPGSRMLQFASIGFDASVLEIAPALAAGATVVLASRGDLLPGPDLARTLREKAITHALIPPPALAVMPEVELRDLRCLLVGGEECPPALAARWAPGRRLLNAYGPTEGTVCATVAEVSGCSERLPLGDALAGVEVLVVDRWGGLAPVGVSGELWIGGVGLARGYEGRPDLTAERFVPHGWSEQPGARLYRTGDRVRRRGDGSLEFLGRVDRQVKIRGVRIEPGELEVVLGAQIGVRQAVVEARPGPGGPRLVAWVVPDEGVEREALPGALRSALRASLPEAMIPALFVVVDGLPLTSSGKVDRAALPLPREERAAPEASGIPEAGLERDLTAVWREVLDVESVGLDDNFFDLGGHSLLLVELQGRIRERLGVEVPLLDLFRFPNVRALAKHLGGQETDEAGLREAVARQPVVSRDVAIVGMAGRFPGAADPEQLWRNLREGVESIRTFSERELREASVDLDTPGLVPAGGFLDEADRFDAAFFDIGPREAQFLDPQQRVFLEHSAEALERAGYGAGSAGLEGVRVGVFAGTGSSTYAIQNLFSNPAATGMDVTIANETEFLATRVAYKLDLRGPALTVQTACSTSLVAIHLACKSLLQGECDMALAGGVTIHFPQAAGYVYQEGGVTSPDGHNRAFDARAGGTVGGNGSAVVLLKPLDKALADGDVIHAVIKASALNNDGAGKVGFTAPSEEGQARVIAEAQALAGIHPDTVRYIEAHGSATPLGDPIEVAALTRAFRAGGSRRRGVCALGSVKANIGHTGSAAGAAGLLRAVLALKNREIPPSVHFESPNPQIDFAASPFYVPTALEPWTAEDGAPRRAGVSSFGLGGTNVHAVLEEAPAPEPASPSREWQLLTVSARTASALEAATDRLAKALNRGGVDLADAAYTLHLGRKAFEHRRVLVCRAPEDALEALRSRDPRRVLSHEVPKETSRPVAFVFSGLGEQYPGMAAGLYRAEPAFREPFDRCAELLAPAIGADLRELLFHEDGSGGMPGGSAGTDLRRLLGRAPAGELGSLDRTAILQPALFAVEYALARMWMAWGVEPQALIGYSLGEYVAACLAGVLSLEDALRLVAERARLIDALPEGAMLAVSLPEAEVLPLLEELPELSLAAANGPALSVVAGPVEVVAALEEILSDEGIAHRRLRTTHAFHSRMLEPAARPLASFVEGLTLRPPRIPYVSNVTGTWIAPGQATDPGYWAEHLCRPVRFSEGIGELWREAGRVLLEVGPGGSLAALALQHPAAAEAADPVAVATLRSAYEQRPDQAFLLSTLGKLWLSGVRVDWRGFHGQERRRRVELPAYPFERKRYWIDRIERSESVPAASGLYLPAWRRSMPLPAAQDLAGRWLIFTDASGLGDRIADRLAEAGATVTRVIPGESFEQRSPGLFALNPAQGDHYSELLWALGSLPDRVVHLWSLEEEAGSSFHRAQERGFLSLLSLVHALAQRVTPGEASPIGSLEALVVSSGLQRVTAADPFRPEGAPLLSLVQTLPLELQGVICRGVDVDLPAPVGWRQEKQVEALLAELVAAREGDAGEAVAYRGGERWSRSFEPVSATAGSSRLPAGSAVLLLGRPEGALFQGAAALATSPGSHIRLALVQTAEPTVELPFEPAFRATVGRGEEAALSAALAEARERLGSFAVAVVDLNDLSAPVAPLALVRRDGAGTALEAAAQRLDLLARFLEADRCAGRVILLSSLEAYAAQPGAALRAALHQWAGAFAEARFTEGPVPWTAVAWDREAVLEPRRAGEALLRILAQGPVARLAVSPEHPASWRRRRSDEAVPAQGDAGLGLHSRPNLRNPYVAPGTETERAVVDTWQKLLGLEEVGIHDSFFDLGGDSLLATQVMTRIREGFGVQVSLPEFFETPTPAALAERIDSTRPTGRPEVIANLIDQVENLSLEEVERMLAERGVSLDDLPELDTEI